MNIMLQCFDTAGSATGRASPCKKWLLMCWWLCSFATVSFICHRHHCHLRHLLLQQNPGWFDILVSEYLGYLEKLAVKTIVVVVLLQQPL